MQKKDFTQKGDLNRHRTHTGERSLCVRQVSKRPLALTVTIGHIHTLARSPLCVRYAKEGLLRRGILKSITELTLVRSPLCVIYVKSGLLRNLISSVIIGHTLARSPLCVRYAKEDLLRRGILTSITELTQVRNLLYVMYVRKASLTEAVLLDMPGLMKERSVINAAFVEWLLQTAEVAIGTTKRNINEIMNKCHRSFIPQ
ncbi:hypothetical protein AVEN_109986-1 [Araneus ventricosus]|uniref:Uncharacterized protein n=1 Tax=Araneus ventricosus TaxID=182803 RepID=A0A4Y2VTW7_ARAVE|nr:hypothetical protein AVEN_109986-1 [Araneus ventricosus]